MGFRCYICGRNYDTPVKAAECIINCDKAQGAEKQAKLKEIRDEITKKYKELETLCKQFSDLSNEESVRISLQTYNKVNFPQYIPECSDIPFINTATDLPKDREVTKLHSNIGCITKMKTTYI